MASHPWRRAVRLWTQGARPQTLSLSLTPVVAGLVYAFAVYGAVEPVPVVAAMISAVSIQIAANLANDAADGRSGADNANRLGPLRLVGMGAMSAAAVQRGALAASCVAALFGLIVVYYGGAPILALGISSLIAAWGYSYGPAPISRSPLGELFVIAFFGVAAVMGVVWLCARQTDEAAVWLGLAIGLPAAAVLTLNNHRDRLQDAAAGRRTLAILLGPRHTPILYGAELAGASLAAMIGLWPLSRASAILGVVGVLVAVRLSLNVARTPISRALNPRFAATIRFQMGLTAGIVATLLIGATRAGQ